VQESGAALEARRGALREAAAQLCGEITGRRDAGEEEARRGALAGAEGRLAAARAEREALEAALAALELRVAAARAEEAAAAVDAGRAGAAVAALEAAEADAAAPLRGRLRRAPRPRALAPARRGVAGGGA
jgi:hypothetical protein